MPHVIGTVLVDSWFGNVKNMALMVEKGEQFIMPLKANRQGALVDATDSTKTEYVPVQSLELQEDTPVSVWLKGYSKPLLLCRQVFKNKDNSTGILYLVTADLTATYSSITTTYQRRWAVETYHRSLKNNTSVCASPTKTIKTPCNHIYAGEELDLVVVYRPSSIEIDDTVLIFFSNDPDEDSLVVSLTGSGVAPPMIAISLDSLSGALSTGETFTQLLNIANKQRRKYELKLEYKSDSFFKSGFFRLDPFGKSGLHH